MNAGFTSFTLSSVVEELSVNEQLVVKHEVSLKPRRKWLFSQNRPKTSGNVRVFYKVLVLANLVTTPLTGIRLLLTSLKRICRYYYSGLIVESACSKDVKVNFNSLFQSSAS